MLDDEVAVAGGESIAAVEDKGVQELTCRKGNEEPGA